MDNMDFLSNELQVSTNAQNYLTESARWGKFLAIIGFVLCGLMVLIAVFVPTFIFRLPPYNNLPAAYNTAMQAGITIVYLLVAVLFKFSAKMQLAVKSVSQEKFDDSLMNLKSMFKFYGIMTIIFLSFYALIFVVAMIGLAMKG